MFAWILRYGFITVTMLVKIAGLMAWMIMMFAGGFLRHYNSPFAMSFGNNGGSAAAFLDAGKLKSYLA